uniref:Mitochondrial inner membrane protease subunit 2 n=1 Tax=Aegilops tauschii subsp. strangulata TaxID=200361 RepID=A0A453GB50_AEGTS
MEGKAYHKRVVSRLIALPGDLVRLRGTTELLEVPEGHCWVEGDNPSQSKDSRTYGPVPLSCWRGRSHT